MLRSAKQVDFKQIIHHLRIWGTLSAFFAGGAVSADISTPRLQSQATVLSAAVCFAQL